jgi:hypothetical protein
MPRPALPFTPKTNTHLLPGDFWSLPLSDGRFCAGRVLAKPAFGPTDRLGIHVGLLDWIGSEPPTASALAGCRVLASAKARVEAIANTGGQVLGNRSLDEDGIAPPAPEKFAVGEKTSVWGWRTILNRAEAHFLGGT